MSVPQEFLMVKVPRPEARAKKPGVAARAMVEYLIFATRVFIDVTKGLIGFVVVMELDGLLIN